VGDAQAPRRAPEGPRGEAGREIHRQQEGRAHVGTKGREPEWRPRAWVKEGGVARGAPGPKQSVWQVKGKEKAHVPGGQRTIRINGWASSRPLGFWGEPRKPGGPCEKKVGKNQKRAPKNLTRGGVLSYNRG